ncbi:hypothetical protein EVAR_66076_1 [Eumeta japonica]|uniref:Uncharacterized protein n=1 Tax=Eumeta variegata TaxID=151549 RepID=A0A4C2A4P3_EUMVA|nr:hypothetical protein EVAR_66076_1 [Eumeta japonica]
MAAPAEHLGRLTARLISGRGLMRKLPRAEASSPVRLQHRWFRNVLHRAGAQSGPRVRADTATIIRRDRELGLLFSCKSLHRAVFFRFTRTPDVGSGVKTHVGDLLVHGRRAARGPAASYKYAWSASSVTGFIGWPRALFELLRYERNSILLHYKIEMSFVSMNVYDYMQQCS